MMAWAEMVFGMKFILLGPAPPTVCLRGYDTDGTFKGTKVRHTIQYDALYNSDVGDVVEAQCRLAGMDGCVVRPPALARHLGAPAHQLPPHRASYSF